jgi:iron complex outermembrane receptor protein
MTKIVSKKFGFIRIALAAGVGFPLFIATSANAQTPAASPGEATTERVVVVGSNLPTTETESALPVTTYSAEILQKVGANTPAEGLRQLPSYVGDTATENNSNGGDGQAFITLRGLGPANTLTIIDGRRAFGFSNINAIPIGAISRVEILKDGASAVYGSDAVAGVVNFILLDGPGEAPYEGAESFFLYGNTTDHDARVLNGYLKGGVTGLDGKVAIAAVGEYYDRNDLYSRDRDIAKSADRRSLGGNNQGSPTFAGRGVIRDNVLSGIPPTFVARERILIDPSNNAPSSLADYRLFTGATDPDAFNFRFYTPAIPGVEKASYFVAGRYKIFDDMVQMYGSIMYSKTKQDNGLAPAPFAIGAGVAGASPFNPFLPGRVSNLRYRLVQELGNRRSFYDYDYYRYTVGFKGDFNVKDNQFVSNWGYDAGFVYERNDQLRIDSGDATATGIFGAITTPVNIGGVNTFFNPFIGQTAAPSGDVPHYIAGVLQPGTFHYDNIAIAQLSAYLGHSFFYERDYLYDIKVNGNLFPGLWNGGVGVVVGYEHYNTATHQQPDPVQVADDQLGFGASPNTKYLREENAYFGELKIPLVVSTMNWAWMRSAELNFAYRFETFDNKDQYIHTESTFDSGGTPRLAIRLQPIEDVVLRASWGQSFLSPASFQLFDPVTENAPQVIDTSRLTNGGAPFQPIDGVWQGGNPLLTPEETDSYGAGIVWTPKFIRDWTGGTFTASVDFYQIFTQNVILPADQLAQLILTINGNAILAGTPPAAAPFAIPNVNPGVGGIGVARDPNSANSVTFINSQTANAGKRLVNGMDVNLIYQLPTPNWGQFTWRLGYNYFFTWKAEPVAGAGFTSFAGNFTATLPLAPGAIPYHKGFLSGEWEWRGWDFIVTGNYISSYNDDSGNVLAATVIGGTPTNPAYDIYRRVTDYITLDMQLGYEFRKPVTEAVAASYAKDAKDAKSASAPVGGADNGTIYQRMIWNTKFALGVNNAFDRNPPTTLGAFNDNYDTSLYTIRNRYWYASITKRF